MLKTICLYGLFYPYPLIFLFVKRGDNKDGQKCKEENGMSRVLLLANRKTVE
jgi:hypothetical protein